MTERPPSDPDPWCSVGLGDSWAHAAALFSAEDSIAAGAAWARASEVYEAYREVYQQHLPASRWDYDYGPELAVAKTRRGPAPGNVAPGFAPFVALALQARYAEAIALVAERPKRRVERAIVRILSSHCGGDRSDVSERLARWGKESTLAELAAATAIGVSARTSEGLSHLDYPPDGPDCACITLGVVREGLWRGFAVLLERGPLRAAYVAVYDRSAISALEAIELDDDDTAPIISAATRYLIAIGATSPPLAVVSVVCDVMQILWGNLAVPRGRWLPRFASAGGTAPRASIDLDGPPGIAWEDLVTVAPVAAGVVVEASSAHGAPGARLEVRTPTDLVAIGARLVSAVRAAVDSRAGRGG